MSERCDILSGRLGRMDVCGRQDRADALVEGMVLDLNGRRDHDPAAGGKTGRAGKPAGKYDMSDVIG